jgi:ribosome modulation factor
MECVMRDELLVECGKEGRIAFFSGRSRESCPHPLGTPDRRLWLRGYDFAARTRAAMAGASTVTINRTAAE